jgi:adenosylmethionine-8-amino-7-oxononanoate aminotransferase
MASAAAGRLAPPASVHVSAGLLRDGATVIRRGRGVIIKNDRDRESIEAAVGLWCVNVGHGCRPCRRQANERAGVLSYLQRRNR